MKIIIDLDTVFDIRLSLLYRLGIKPVNYVERTNDKFGGLDSDEFSMLIDKTKDTLYTTAIPTGMSTFIQEYIIETIAIGNDTMVDLHINVGSTKITPEMEKRLIELFWSNKLTLHIDSEPITIEELANTDVYVTYNGVKLVSKYLSDKSLFTTPIINLHLITTDLIEGDVLERDKALSNLKEQFKAFVNIDFLKISAFSAI